MPARIRVVVDVPLHFVRPRNTDWRYMRHGISGMSELIPVDFVYPVSLWDQLSYNARYLLPAVARRSGIPPGNKYKCIRRVRHGYFDGLNGDLVYSHDDFPSCDTSLPILWRYSVLDPEMQMRNGVGAASIAEQYREQCRGYSAAKRVLSTSRATVERHRERFPDMAEKFVSSPFFVPHIAPCDERSIRKRYSDNGPVRILFVGREAVRKGLAEVLDALDIVFERSAFDFRMTVVSSFSDGFVDMRRGYDIDWHKELPASLVGELMAESHVFVMPSRFESYGIVFLEAMARGCVVVAPDWEVQRELVDGAGVVVEPNGRDIADALMNLVDGGEMLPLALAGADRYRREHAPEVVARRYLGIFESMIG